MSKKMILDLEQELVDNPTPRVPIALCLDISGSMLGRPIAELKSGVELFHQSVAEDDIAKYSAEISIVTFGGEEAKQLTDYRTLDQGCDIPELKAAGMTPMGEAVNLALDSLEERRDLYIKMGVDSFTPWMILMTDGQPNGDQGELKRSIERVQKLVKRGDMTLIPIGVGEKADYDTLKQFSPELEVLKLNGLKFREFFDWLGKSVKQTSRRLPGDDLPFNIEDLKKQVGVFSI